MDLRLRAAVALVIDLALVGLFVVIGRASHREDQSAFLVTYWPFAVGLLVGWAGARGWRRPFSVSRTGVLAWVGTVLVGMLLRWASDQGVQVAFVVVASIVVGALLIGWRVLLAAIDRSASRGRDTPGPVGFFLRRR
ncbi:DUF3054 domain-containing protein [Amnibacterium setariae]|uniref:DUF3054 domain-containing protein n=1 Tax=Amnibacterium setariae TaxID=2306585 RepID=A0A3A1U5Y7_9MICO|nr:DUF3054 domain-containing protein [Amnibacterium setariae]RIX30418.1 DUF3054 domain-containing protein [Amnibacterium setariae]